MPPTVAAGLADTPRGFDFIVGLVDAALPKSDGQEKNLRHYRRL
jgi:hypothetical protein